MTSPAAPSGTGSPTPPAAFPPQHKTPARDESTERQLELLTTRIELIENDDRKAAEAIDRIILVGGPATILASLSFMKDMAPVPAPGSLWFLLIAWALLLAGAVAGIAGLYTTRLAGRALRRLYERKVAAGVPRIESAEYDDARRWNNLTRRTNYTGVGAFLIGILFLLVFAAVNLPGARGTALPGTRPALDSASVALLGECRTTGCVIYMGYDYDIAPRDTTRPRIPTIRRSPTQAGAPIPPTPGTTR